MFNIGNKTYPYTHTHIYEVKNSRRNSFFFHLKILHPHIIITHFCLQFLRRTKKKKKLSLHYYKKKTGDVHNNNSSQQDK